MALYWLIENKIKIMKKLAYFLFTSLVFTACSQCYECTHMVEIEQNGVITEQEVTEDFCTAVPDEIDQKEAEGFNCSPA